MMRALRIFAYLDHDNAFDAADPNNLEAPALSAVIDGERPLIDELARLEDFRRRAINLAQDALIPRADYQNPCGSFGLRAGADRKQPLHELVIVFEKEFRLPESWRLQWTSDGAPSVSMVCESTQAVLRLIAFLINDATGRWLKEVSFQGTGEPAAAAPERRPLADRVRAAVGSIPLLTLGAVLASGAPLPSCLPPKGTPRGIEQFRDCQKRDQERFWAAHREGKGGEPPLELRETFEEHQRAEMRRFIRDNPNQTLIDRTPDQPTGKSAAAESGSGLDAALSYLSEIFASMNINIKELFGGKGIDKNSREYRGAQEAMRGFSEHAKKGGVDIKSLTKESLKEPAQLLRKSVTNYNKNMKENLDPSMHKFFKKETK